ncbi:MAG: hypothetical protein JWQ73_3339 [Variovorax sp.]|jgi:hypothetical protein|nr:hypothetical protein [Variovorax sp.]
MATARVIKGGLIVLAPGGGVVQRTVALQYNPETLTRSFEPQGAGGTGAQPYRFTGPAIESIQLVATLDATDALEHAGTNPAVARAGIAPQLALLEALVQPAAADLMAAAQRPEGTQEVPLVLFVWGAHRVVPVRVTQLSIVEEAFDRALNPLRARVSLGLRVLTTADFGPAHRGSALFLAYLRGREALAQMAPVVALEALGLAGLP